MADLRDLLPFTKKLSLLHMDADAGVRKPVSESMKKIFSLVDDTETGYEGLSSFKINQHDIVVMDANVPNMTNMQLINNIKTAKPEQHIIYTTENDLSMDEVVTLINAGVSAYLKKPYTVESLLETIAPSVKIAYKQMQQRELLERTQTVKEQHEYVIQTSKEREQKLKDELLYERKRLGRLMQQIKELEKGKEKTADKSPAVKHVNELTGAASKLALQEALKSKISKALLYLNIDNFDMINTIYGMGQGNKVLVETVKRLEKFLPNNGSLFHITADEFVILLNEPVENQEKIFAEQILSLFREAPIEIEENSYKINFSIGADRGEGMQLFVQAKAASKEAKEHGGACVRFYQADSDYMLTQRRNLYWIRMVKEAIEHDKLIPYYQPIVSNTDSSMQHYEVLCRIENKEGKLIDASEFIDIAKKAGLVTQISRIIIDKAFKHFSSNHYLFSININRYDLEEQYLEELLLYKCDRYGIVPKRVYLELVEDISISNSEVIIKQIQRLRDAGFHIAVDDFGTEHSMLSRMLQVQADFIKIDSTFIQDLATNQFHRVVVENIVAFARKTGMKTVAEHVDSESLHRIVHDLGVDYSQGYYIGKPVSKSRM
ncbi:MAG: EAL domain-containing protein [Campylobacterota bacterium]|nr:EAL domain-containing protein [Campylobacterota bacterium]